MMVRQQQHFLADISPTSRHLEQSSPSDNSLSSSTPQHQTSRVSPASTVALTMSHNNINQDHQSSSRQLTPSTNNSSNNGTGSSSNGNTGTRNGCAPNPMVRQFTCHAKSMSAGVVVPVPGISNNLATATGMNQNNIINDTIAANQTHHVPNHHHTRDPHHQHHAHRPQQVAPTPRNLHQQQMSQPNPHQHQHHHHHNHHNPQNQSDNPTSYSNNHSSSNVNNNPLHHTSNRQAAGSSIIFGHNNNNNVNSLHHKSASAHLSSVLMNNHMPASNHHLQSHHNTANSRNYPPNNVINSIWSIDENISKSHGKLTGSHGFISHPYLFNPSITDMSCDNVSNASRLVDGAPAPGYFVHHAPSNLPNTNAISASGSLKMPEFLPICDLLFNLMSMILYFCENVFGIIAIIALYYHSQNRYWAFIGAACVFASNFVCQYVSLRWLYKAKLEDCRRKREAQEELEDEEDCERRYYNRMASNLGSYPCGSCTWLPDSATEVQLKFLLSIVFDAILHIFCMGFLLRYIKLVIPVADTARVKKEARDLCMLRMMHGFIQSAPLLLLQAYIICSQTSPATITNLSVTSAMLSLINVCWALASFTKYARRKYMHKFVLSWLGILSQLFWRLGTVSSRVVALTIYAVYYSYWMLIVLLLHWLTMFLWLIKPGNLLRDEVNFSRARKTTFALAAAWIYCFCYMNFEEHNSKLKMISYYSVMFLENNLLLTVSLIFSTQVTWFKNLSILVVYLGFVFGMLSMFIYYKYFHINVLNNGLSCSQESIDSIADQLSPAGKKITGFKPGTLRLKSDDALKFSHRYNTNIGATLHTGSHPEITREIKPPYLTSSHAPLAQCGVFSCKTTTSSKKRPVAHSRRHHNP